MPILFRGAGSGSLRVEGTHWGNIGVILGLYWGYIEIMEKKMDTTIVYGGYFGIMENKLEITVWGLGLRGRSLLAANGSH